MAADPSAWEVATAIGQLLAGGSAVIGLVFVGLQIRAARRSTDIHILQEFNQRTIEREFAFLNAAEGDQKEQAFIELLNFLEVNAAAFNGGLLPSVSRKIIRDSLANSIAAIQLAPYWAEKFGNAVRTASTFEELGHFMSAEKKTINEIVKMMQARRAAQRSPRLPMAGAIRFGIAPYSLFLELDKRCKKAKAPGIKPSAIPPSSGLAPWSQLLRRGRGAYSIHRITAGAHGSASDNRRCAGP